MTLDATLHYVACDFSRAFARYNAWAPSAEDFRVPVPHEAHHEAVRHRDIETSNSEETGMKRIEKRGWKKRGCGR